MEDHDLEKRYWVALNATRGIGPARIRRLVDHFDSLAEAWQAAPLALAEAGLDRRAIEALTGSRDTLDLARLWSQIEALGITVLTWDDAEYPHSLRNIAQSPPVLYVRGELRPEDDWAIAVVGTRAPSPYGREVTQRLSESLALAGVTVVSGLARGIDGIAHRAALGLGGRTIAVLASGLDTIYPREHEKLASEIIEQGALVSDYPPGTRPESGNFPARNRLISGLSRATLVVEAGIKSGALITAEFALEQGRDVYAVPGSILSVKSAGPNRLIRDGARPVLGPEALLEDLELSRMPSQLDARATLATAPEEDLILAALSGDPLHIDEIAYRTEIEMAEVAGHLALLELKGMVRQVGQMHYVVIREPGAAYNAG